MLDKFCYEFFQCTFFDFFFQTNANKRKFNVKINWILFVCNIKQKKSLPEKHHIRRSFARRRQKTPRLVRNSESQDSEDFIVLYVDAFVSHDEPVAESDEYIGGRGSQ